MIDEGDYKSRETKAQDPTMSPRKVSRESNQKERSPQSSARSLSQQPSDLWNVQDDSILDMLDEDEEIAEKQESTPPATCNVTNKEQPSGEKNPATSQPTKPIFAPSDTARIK
jgi:hypothetical protein